MCFYSVNVWLHLVYHRIYYLNFSLSKTLRIHMIPAELVNPNRCNQIILNETSFITDDTKWATYVRREIFTERVSRQGHEAYCLSFVRIFVYESNRVPILTIQLQKIFHVPYRYFRFHTLEIPTFCQFSP